MYLVKFFFYGRIIGQGAVLKNGFVVTKNISTVCSPSSEVFENTINYSINKLITVRNNNPQNTTITILVQSLEISKYEIASNAFVLGTDEQSLKEFQQYSNFTLDISLGEELQIKPFLYFDEWKLFQSRKSCLNKNGELLGIISGKFKNKTQVVPTTYFQGLKNGRNHVKAYLGLSLNTYNKGSTFIIKINLKVLQRRQVQKLGEIIQCIDGVTIQHCKDVTKVVSN